ncbi:hypothetical protein [Streptomyces sp. NPDC048248]|uniref:hypothetical protein n=1 Tax=Streptomyces sp. NPDC048248 TaxID=3365523 RepID=UPI003718F49C
MPLSEAQDSGASKWSAERREQYANDLGAERSLVAVSLGPTAPRATRTRPSGCRRPRTPPAPTSQTGWPPNSVGR